MKLAEGLNTRAESCVFIGDEEKDIIGANRAGMLSVLLDRNHRNSDYGQKHTIRDLNELLAML